MINVIFHATFVKNMATFEGLTMLPNSLQTKRTFNFAFKMFGFWMQMKNGA